MVYLMIVINNCRLADLGEDSEGELFQVGNIGEEIAQERHRRVVAIRASPQLP
jgi:hypothetical protein